MTRSVIQSVALTLMLVGVHAPAQAATCSCAGIPLLGSIDTSAIEAGQLFISYTTEEHQISDLVAGHRDVPDETGRDRESFSQVLSASYAITDRWSVSALVSWVEHKRRIGASVINDSTVTSGFGDSVVLARYTPLIITPFSRHQWSLGLGVRIPTGEDKLTDGFSVLSEDLQPSVGAMAKIVWTGYSYAFNQAATVKLNASANFIANEENDRGYAFGDEISLSLGISQNIGPRFGYSAAVHYRNAEAHERFGAAIPNTGGEWLDFVPAVHLKAGDRLNLSLFGRIPVARDLDGALQFTTRYSYGFSASYGF